MHKLVAFLLALTLVAAACGDSGSSGAFSDCDDLAQGGLDMLQDILNEVSNMSMGEFIEESGRSA